MSIASLINTDFLVVVDADDLPSYLLFRLNELIKTKRYERDLFNRDIKYVCFS